MTEETKGGWQPDSDTDYGQMLVRHLLVKYRGVLLGSLIAGAALAVAVTLLIAPTYSSNATIIVNTGGSSSTSMLSGLAFLGGGSSDLENEIQIITSRDLAKEAIAEQGLQVEVVDYFAPDASIMRLARALRIGGKSSGTRLEQFSRLQIRDVSVSTDLLREAKLNMKVTNDGRWSVKGNSGASGEPVVFDAFTFTPIIGANAAGTYRLVVKPDLASLKDFKDNLGAYTANDNASVITVSFKYRNPFICRDVVDLVVGEYLQRYEESAIGDYDIILDYIQDEIEVAQNKSLATIAELDEYREKNKLYQPSAQAAAAIGSVATLSLARSETQIQLRQVESLLNSMDSRTPEQLYDSIQSPLKPLAIDASLVEQLANVNKSLSTARLTMTDAHPNVQRVLASRDIVIEQIRDSLESSVEQLKLADSQLSREIGAGKGQLLGLPAAESKIALLTSELEVNTEILAMLKKSEAETKLLREETTTDVRLLDTPLVAIKPGSPRFGKNALLGGFAGLILAILLSLLVESSRRKIGTLREIRLGLGLPVITVLDGGKPRGGWKPRELGADHFTRLGKYLHIENRRIGIINLRGTAGGFDLAWGLAGTGTGGKRSLLLDADQLYMGLSKALDQGSGPGFAELAKDSEKAPDAIKSVDDFRSLLGPGDGCWEPETAKAALTKISAEYSTMLICLPAPRQWIDQDAIASELDSVVISLPQQGSTAAELSDAVAQLADYGIKPVGVVITTYSVRRDSLGADELDNLAVAPG